MLGFRESVFINFRNSNCSMQLYYISVSQHPYFLLHSSNFKLIDLFVYFFIQELPFSTQIIYLKSLKYSTTIEIWFITLCVYFQVQVVFFLSTGSQTLNF